MSPSKKPPVVEPEMAPAALMQYFAQVPDPRIERSRLHPLSSILLVTLCAIVCGAESFVAVEEWAKARVIASSTDGPPCEDLLQEGIVAGSDQAAGFGAKLLARSGAEQVDGEMPQDGEVLGGVADADSALVFVECHVEYPVKSILDAPMAA